MTLAVRCHGLVKRYPTVTAVDGLDLSVEAGMCLAILGPNGAGKTTTVEMIEGLTEPTAGWVEIFGARWHSGRDREIRGMVGVQLQDTQLTPKLTVIELIRQFKSFYRGGADANALLALVQLEAKRDARYEQLSGGQKQRLALATALVGEPKLVCLDEPTTGLDPQARRAIWDIVAGFVADGGTVLLTTHYMEEAEQLADRVAVMDHGKLIAQGTAPALIASLGAEQIVELEVTPPPTAADWTALPGVSSASVDGASVRLSVQSVPVVMAPLLAMVEARGATLVNLNTHRTTLEDVFVHLTGRALRDG